MLRLRTIGLIAITLTLAGTAGFALRRETAPPPAPAPAPALAAAVEPAALSPQDESYAEALWAIHGPAKVSAVNLSFLGIRYKVETHDRQELGAKAQGLLDRFASAEEQARRLTVPASMRPLHERFLAALDLYRSAAAEMLKTAKDGDDSHLIDGQAMAQHASEEILRIGDVLWPGEYKPN
jgi:hypothetical protein